MPRALPFFSPRGLRRLPFFFSPTAGDLSHSRVLAYGGGILAASRLASSLTCASAAVEEMVLRKASTWWKGATEWASGARAGVLPP